MYDKNYKAALDATDIARKKLKEEDAPKQRYHVVYLNDNYYAISSEWIEAFDQVDAGIVAENRHPYGLRSGIKRIRSVKQYTEWQTELKAEQEAAEKDRQAYLAQFK